MRDVVKINILFAWRKGPELFSSEGSYPCPVGIDSTNVEGSGKLIEIKNHLIGKVAGIT